MTKKELAAHWKYVVSCDIAPSKIKAVQQVVVDKYKQIQKEKQNKHEESLKKNMAAFVDDAFGQLRNDKKARLKAMQNDTSLLPGQLA